MAILQIDRFSGTLSQWSLTQTEGSFTIAPTPNHMLIAQTPGSTAVNSWNQIVAVHSASFTAAANYVLYFQFERSDITTVQQFMFVLARTSTPSNNFSNTCGCFIPVDSNLIQLYDDSAGGLGSFSILAATAYDAKLVFNANGTVTLSARASNNYGNLPAATGSWTAVATSTLNDFLTQTIFFSPHMKTAGVEGAFADYQMAEFYVTNDGLFSPSPPTSLAINTYTNTTADLTWSDSNVASGETGVKVERSLTSGSGFSQVATVAQGTTTYQDTGLNPLLAYYYKIRSYITLTGTDYNSAYSSEASVPIRSTGEDDGEDMLLIDSSFGS